MLYNVAETKIADPAAHAKKQVAELDKTAKRSIAKRKFITEQLEKDEKEIHHIDAQIARINERYLPLCAHLKESQECKENLTAMLDSCVRDEKSIMSSTIAMVNERKMDDSKLTRKMATAQLAEARGFTIKPDSTFHQTAHRALDSGTMGSTKK